MTSLRVTFLLDGIEGALCRCLHKAVDAAAAGDRIHCFRNDADYDYIAAAAAAAAAASAAAASAAASAAVETAGNFVDPSWVAIATRRNLRNRCFAALHVA
eukprot:scaffold695_cov279-Chaetoceros_neogracile.AAC.29